MGKLFGPRQSQPITKGLKESTISGRRLSFTTPRGVWSTDKVGEKEARSKIPSFYNPKTRWFEKTYHRSVSTQRTHQLPSVLFTNTWRGSKKGKTEPLPDEVGHQIGLSSFKHQTWHHSVAYRNKESSTVPDRSSSIRMESITLSVLPTHVSVHQDVEERTPLGNVPTLRRRFTCSRPHKDCKQSYNQCMQISKECWVDDQPEKINSSSDSILRISWIHTFNPKQSSISNDNKVQSNLQTHFVCAQIHEKALHRNTDWQTSSHPSSLSRAHLPNPTCGRRNEASQMLGSKDEAINKSYPWTSPSKRVSQIKTNGVHLPTRRKSQDLYRLNPSGLGSLFTNVGTKIRQIQDRLEHFRARTHCSNPRTSARTRQLCYTPFCRQHRGSLCTSIITSKNTSDGGTCSDILGYGKNKKVVSQNQLDSNIVKYRSRPLISAEQWIQFNHQANQLIPPITESTRKLYQTAYNRFKQESGDANPFDPQAWIQLATAKKCKPNTQASYLIAALAHYRTSGIDIKVEAPRLYSFIKSLAVRLIRKNACTNASNKQKHLKSPKRILEETRAMVLRLAESSTTIENSLSTTPPSVHQFQKAGWQQAQAVAAILTFLASGCRASDILAMKTCHVVRETNGWMLHVPNVKMKRTRTVPITSPILENWFSNLNSAFKFTSRTFLFQPRRSASRPSSYLTLSKYLSNTGIMLHDFRRSHCSYAVAADVPVGHIKKICDWDTSSMVALYAKNVLPCGPSFKTHGKYYQALGI